MKFALAFCTLVLFKINLQIQVSFKTNQNIQGIFNINNKTILNVGYQDYLNTYYEMQIDSCNKFKSQDLLLHGDLLK